MGVAVPCEESDQIQIRRLYSRVKGKEQREGKSEGLEDVGKIVVGEREGE